MKFRTFIDDSVGLGQTTVSDIQSSGDTYGVGISSDIDDVRNTDDPVNGLLYEIFPAKEKLLFPPIPFPLIPSVVIY